MSSLNAIVSIFRILLRPRDSWLEFYKNSKSISMLFKWILVPYVLFVFMSFDIAVIKTGVIFHEKNMLSKYIYSVYSINASYFQFSYIINVILYLCWFYWAAPYIVQAVSSALSRKVNVDNARAIVSIPITVNLVTLFLLFLIGGFSFNLHLVLPTYILYVIYLLQLALRVYCFGIVAHILSHIMKIGIVASLLSAFLVFTLFGLSVFKLFPKIMLYV